MENVISRWSIVVVLLFHLAISPAWADGARSSTVTSSHRSGVMQTKRQASLTKRAGRVLKRIAGAFIAVSLIGELAVPHKPPPVPPSSESFLRVVDMPLSVGRHPALVYRVAGDTKFQRLEIIDEKTGDWPPPLRRAPWPYCDPRRYAHLQPRSPVPAESF
jgi:hypothetical protein